jgi:hypothetical protein
MKPRRNRPAMLTLKSDRFQDQEVKGPLGSSIRSEDIGLPFRFDTTKIPALLSKCKGYLPFSYPSCQPRFVEQRLGLGTIITNGQVAATLFREAVTPVFAESKSFRRMWFTFDAAHRSIGRGDASVVDPRRTTTENRGK